MASKEAPAFRHGEGSHWLKTRPQAAPSVGTYIEFHEVSSNPKTKRWVVRTKAVGGERFQFLGRISWYGQWRCYSFFPAKNTVFEHKCLGEIAEFINYQTSEHRRLLREASA